MNIRNWFLPPDLLPDFDPETFEAPSNAITPTRQIFATPIRPGDLPLLIESSFNFQVLAVPENSTVALVLIGFAAIVAGARHRALLTK